MRSENKVSGALQAQPEVGVGQRTVRRERLTFDCEQLVALLLEPAEFLEIGSGIGFVERVGKIFEQDVSRANGRRSEQRAQDPKLVSFDVELHQIEAGRRNKGGEFARGSHRDMKCDFVKVAMESGDCSKSAAAEIVVIGHDHAHQTWRIRECGAAELDVVQVGEGGIAQQRGGVPYCRFNREDASASRLERTGCPQCVLSHMRTEVRETRRIGQKHIKSRERGELIAAVKQDFALHVVARVELHHDPRNNLPPNGFNTEQDFQPVEQAQPARVLGPSKVGADNMVAESNSAMRHGLESMQVEFHGATVPAEFQRAIGAGAGGARDLDGDRMLVHGVMLHAHFEQLHS